jgi:hypothetical protein
VEVNDILASDAVHKEVRFIVAIVSLQEFTSYGPWLIDVTGVYPFKLTKLAERHPSKSLELPLLTWKTSEPPWYFRVVLNNIPTAKSTVTQHYVP